MKRRTFISSAGAAAFSAPVAFGHTPLRTSYKSELIKPKALRQGDTVGLIAPSTAVTDPERIALYERTLNYFGLKMKLARNATKRMSDYSTSISDRLDDMHSMFSDPTVNAVFAVRGGYGSEHLLDRIDYDLIRKHPKVFLGYSDITALHLAINRHAGLVTFHGPIVLSRFTEYTQQHFRRALFETSPIGELSNPPESNPLRPSHNLRTVRAGRASGPLIGGNLTLISTTLGTPYEIDTKGAILFIEDVDEEPYSIDRMLTHLRLAGKFTDIKGLIFGECEDCKPHDYKPSTVLPWSVSEVVDNILGSLKVPVLSGLTIGHTDDQLTLPLGVMATLDADRKSLTIDESALV